MLLINGFSIEYERKKVVKNIKKPSIKTDRLNFFINVLLTEKLLSKLAKKLKPC